MTRLVLRHVEVLRDIVDGADLLEHGEHSLVRAAVGRTPERRDTSRNRRVRVRTGAAGKAHSGRTRVLLMVGVQHEQEVERL